MRRASQQTTMTPLRSAWMESQSGVTCGSPAGSTCFGSALRSAGTRVTAKRTTSSACTRMAQVGFLPACLCLRPRRPHQASHGWQILVPEHCVVGPAAVPDDAVSAKNACVFFRACRILQRKMAGVKCLHDSALWHHSNCNAAANTSDPGFFFSAQSLAQASLRAQG